MLQPPLRRPGTDRNRRQIRHATKKRRSDSCKFELNPYLCTTETEPRFRSAYGESVAQQVEHNTFNVGVLGSSPSGFTESYLHREDSFFCRALRFRPPPRRNSLPPDGKPFLPAKSDTPPPPGLPNSRTAEQPDSRTPRLPNSRTPERPNYRTLGHPTARTPKHPDSRTLKLSDTRTPGRPDENPYGYVRTPPVASSMSPMMPTFATDRTIMSRILRYAHEETRKIVGSLCRAASSFHRRVRSEAWRLPRI